MIVVADTSPLNYFVQIGCESVLSSLYQRVLIPPSVLDELGHAGAPKIVGEWLLDLPRWIEVRRTAAPPDAALADLDPGERDAIQLAQEQRADLLLTSDSDVWWQNVAAWLPPELSAFSLLPPRRVCSTLRLPTSNSRRKRISAAARNCKTLSCNGSAP